MVLAARAARASIGGVSARDAVPPVNLAFINTDESLGRGIGADDAVRMLHWSPAGYIVASGHFERGRQLISR